PVDYEAWLKRQATPGSAAAEGRRLFTSYGCSGCHATSSNVHAPPLAGIYGRQVHLADGRTATVNDGYIRDSILLPRRDVVAGYTPIMPSFKGQVSDADLQKLVAYVKSLSPPEDSP
ncbi:MAG TPA: cytochrome c, partial [Alphaproteobacteria bacterium]|nr:cytochrome c [Alphaproteobacteria bacterium]